MSDAPGRPLRVLPQAELDALRAELGVDANGWPANASPLERAVNAKIDAASRAALATETTHEERRAALEATNAREEKPMEVKPGWKTTQFWTTALMTLVVLPLLGWLGNQALSPLGPMLDALGSVSPLLVVVVPIAKTALFGLIAWCVKKLAVNYDDNRTALYLGKAANDNADAAAKAA